MTTTATTDPKTVNTYHCRECGDEVESAGLDADEVIACPKHASAIIDTVQSTPRHPKGTEDFDLPEHHRIERDGDRDLQFSGWLLGEGVTGNGGDYASNWTRGVHVNIYLTTGGNLVCHTERWSNWVGEGERHTAAVCRDAGEVLSWLRNDTCDGQLGRAGKKAWGMACDVWTPLTDDDVEVVS